MRSLILTGSEVSSLYEVYSRVQLVFVNTIRATINDKLAFVSSGGGCGDSIKGRGGLSGLDSGCDAYGGRRIDNKGIKSCSHCGLLNHTIKVSRNLYGKSTWANQTMAIDGLSSSSD